MDMNLVDPGVRKLVAAMNALPSVWTYSSCEGHEAPAGCQCPAGRFYVAFSVSRSYRGWRALNVLTRAASAMQTGPVQVVAWENGDPSFQVDGADGADADEFAGRIRRMAAAEARRRAKAKP